MSDGFASERATGLDAARKRLGLSARDVWVGYFAVGGNCSLADVTGWLSGRGGISWRDHNLMAQSLNDAFCERGLNHPVGYLEAP
ncbi:MAG: hypothetical protein ACR2HY_00015 [Acidimicrobiales bacterium]